MKTSMLALFLLITAFTVVSSVSTPPSPQVEVLPLFIPLDPNVHLNQLSVCL